MQELPGRVNRFDPRHLALHSPATEKLPLASEITAALYRHPADVWLVHRRSDDAIMAICPNKTEMVKKMVGMVGEWRAVHRPDLTMQRAIQLGHEQDERFGHTKAPGIDCANKARPSVESQPRYAALTETRRQLAEVAATHPGIELREALSMIRHHYKSDHSALYAARETMRRRHIDGMVCRWTDDGKRCHIWPEGVGQVV